MKTGKQLFDTRLVSQTLRLPHQLFESLPLLFLALQAELGYARLQFALELVKRPSLELTLGRKGQTIKGLRLLRTQGNRGADGLSRRYGVGCQFARSIRPLERFVKSPCFRMRKIIRKQLVLL